MHKIYKLTKCNWQKGREEDAPQSKWRGTLSMKQMQCGMSVTLQCQLQVHSHQDMDFYGMFRRVLVSSFTSGTTQKYCEHMFNAIHFHL